MNVAGKLKTETQSVFEHNISSCFKGISKALKYSSFRILKRTPCLFYIIAAWLLFPACSQDAPVQAEKRPNVVFIMADDQRSDMLSTNGNPYVKTPHLDRLAAEGCNFKNAFTVSGVCSPSRAVFFTGKTGPLCAGVIYEDSLRRGVAVEARQIVDTEVGEEHRGKSDDGEDRNLFPSPAPDHTGMEQCGVYQPCDE